MLGGDIGGKVAGRTGSGRQGQSTIAIGSEVKRKGRTGRSGCGTGGDLTKSFWWWAFAGGKSTGTLCGPSWEGTLSGARELH